VKRAILTFLSLTGAFAPIRLINRSRVLILTYHRFSREEDGRSTSDRTFARQLEYLRSRYRMVPLSFIAARLSRGETVPAATAAITIDDGYSDAYNIALPILRHYRVPATLFVVTGFVDGTLWLWTDKLRFLVEQSPEKFFKLIIDGRSLEFQLGDRPSRLRAAE
jgi:Polysaccharide deacetylase